MKGDRSISLWEVFGEEVKDFWEVHRSWLSNRRGWVLVSRGSLFRWMMKKFFRNIDKYFHPRFKPRTREIIFNFLCKK